MKNIWVCLATPINGVLLLPLNTVVGYDNSQITVQFKESDKNQPESNGQILSRGPSPARRTISKLKSIQVTLLNILKYPCPFCMLIFSLFPIFYSSSSLKGNTCAICNSGRAKDLATSPSCQTPSSVETTCNHGSAHQSPN
jgi:hypothetical protein